VGVGDAGLIESDRLDLRPDFDQCATAYFFEDILQPLFETKTVGDYEVGGSNLCHLASGWFKFMRISTTRHDRCHRGFRPKSTIDYVAQHRGRDNNVDLPIVNRFSRTRRQ